MRKMQAGYVLHPSIPVVEGMKIAEVGAGTGRATPHHYFPIFRYLGDFPLTDDVYTMLSVPRIWLINLAGNLPMSCQLNGFDILGGNYPAKHWPQKVNLGILDAFGDAAGRAPRQIRRGSYPTLGCYDEKWGPETTDPNCYKAA